MSGKGKARMWMDRGGRTEGWRRTWLLRVRRIGGVWNRSSRWTGEQRSEAQEHSLCCGCCLSAGGSVVCLRVTHVLSVLFGRRFDSRFPLCAKLCPLSFFSPCHPPPPPHLLTLSSPAFLLIALTSVVYILRPPEWGWYPDVDHLPSLFLPALPRCDGTYHHVAKGVRRSIHAAAQLQDKQSNLQQCEHKRP